MSTARRPAAQSGGCGRRGRPPRNMLAGGGFLLRGSANAEYLRDQNAADALDTHPARIGIYRDTRLVPSIDKLESVRIINIMAKAKP